MARSPGFVGIGVASFTAGALIAQQVVGKSVRDALFLTTFSAVDLPAMMIVGAILSLSSAVAVSRLLQRHGPRRILPMLFGVSTVAFVGEWLLGFSRTEWMTVAFYLHMALLGPALLSAFWSLVNEHYDPYNAKHAVARIAGGATVGGVVGGLAVWRAADVLELHDLLLAMAGIQLACLVGALLMHALLRATRDAKDSAVRATGEGQGLRALVGAPLLRNLAIVVAIGSATSSLLDYLLSATASQLLGKGAPLLSFFSLFWLSVAVVSMVVQFTLGERVLGRLGLAKNIGALPGLLVVGGLAAIALPSLAAFVVIRGFEAVQRNTLYRSAYELFYTPVAESRKRAAKALIDIGFDRLGTVVGAGLVALFLAVDHEHVTLLVLVAIVALSVATLPFTRMLRANYIAALEGGLRDTASLPALTKDESSGPEEPRAPSAAAPEEVAAAPLEPVSVGEGPIADALRHPAGVVDGREWIGAPAEVAVAGLGALTARSTQPAVAYAIMLLTHRERYVEAFGALSKISAAIAGQLADVLVDPEADVQVRRRVALVLASTGTQRGVDGLLLGVADERFEIRYACSRALMQLVAHHPRLTVDRATILRALLVELDHRARQPAPPVFVPDPLEEMPMFVAPRLHPAADHVLDHVFTVVGLHIDREQLLMAYRALHQDDVRQRGTALEYLQTILPPDFRDAVWPFVGQLATPPPRSARTILADLIRTTSVASRRN
ncbi:MAG: hypothetical protein H0T46_05630 [Deltaproteobacteria bacterium]|nr:hypothetical protein [Deltaproteobacteria bacterium]